MQLVSHDYPSMDNYPLFLNNCGWKRGLQGLGRMDDRGPYERSRFLEIHRICRGSRLTVMTGTSNSSVSMNAARPSGPKASGISSCPAGKVPT